MMPKKVARQVLQNSTFTPSYFVPVNAQKKIEEIKKKFDLNTF